MCDDQVAMTPYARRYNATCVRMCIAWSWQFSWADFARIVARRATHGNHAPIHDGLEGRRVGSRSRVLYIIVELQLLLAWYSRCGTPLRWRSVLDLPLRCIADQLHTNPGRNTVAVLFEEVMTRRNAQKTRAVRSCLRLLSLRFGLGVSLVYLSTIQMRPHPPCMHSGSGHTPVDRSEGSLGQPGFVRLHGADLSLLRRSPLAYAPRPRAGELHGRCR
jgi:hypothetical protein